jgi:hypothetical protein
MKYPPKTTGAIAPAPDAKLGLWTETTAPRAPLQACEHRATVTERLP